MAGSTNQAVLSGLSLALATTVVGLIDAIPALLAYNFLRNEIQKFDLDMEGFSSEILLLRGGISPPCGKLESPPLLRSQTLTSPL